MNALDEPNTRQWTQDKLHSLYTFPPFPVVENYGAYAMNFITVLLISSHDNEFYMLGTAAMLIDYCFNKMLILKFMSKDTELTEQWHCSFFQTYALIALRVKMVLGVINVMQEVVQIKELKLSQVTTSDQILIN